VASVDAAVAVGADGAAVVRAVLGLDIGGTKIAAGVVDPDGGVHGFVTAPTDAASDTGVARLFELGRQAVAESRLEVDAVGIGCGGPLDSANGVLLAPLHLPGWSDVPITALAQEAFGRPAVLDNDGVAAAAGAYLCALDADDRLRPEYFERAVPILDQSPDVAFVSCWLRTFGDEAWDWKPERCDLPTLLWEDTVLTAALVRRDVMLEIGGYDVAMPAQGGEDWDLWLTLAERGFRGTIIPEVLFDYRRRAGSLSTASFYGAHHLPLTRHRITKHSKAYRSHLMDVFEHQDRETSTLLRLNDETERYIASDLEPAVVQRRQELARLRSRLASPAASPLDDAEPDSRRAAEDRLRELEAALAATAAEVDALRASMSWRITQPLRTAYSRWLQWRGAP